MCLAIPGKIISINNNTAEIDFMGAQKKANTSLTDAPLKIGDYVLVHAGFVIQKLSAQDAKNSLDAHNKILIK
jgi:hydrogenase expression/formation protein HypC